MLDGERYYASFPDENPAERPTELVSGVLLNAIKAFERQRQRESEQPLLKVETSCDADACESAKDLRRGCRTASRPWMLAERIAASAGAVATRARRKGGCSVLHHYFAIGIWLGSDTTGPSYRLGKGSGRDAMGVRRQAHALRRPGNLSASLRQGVLQRGSAVALN